MYFFVFCFFLHENKTKSHNFNRFRKVRERATTIVLWENCPKKESAYPKREIDIDRLQIVSYRLQTLLRDYKKLDIDYKLY